MQFLFGLRLTNDSFQLGHTEMLAQGILQPYVVFIQNFWKPRSIERLWCVGRRRTLAIAEQCADNDKVIFGQDLSILYKPERRIYLATIAGRMQDNGIRLVAESLVCDFKV